MSDQASDQVRTTQQRLVDAVCVLVLVTLVLLGFDETFSSREYLGTGLTSPAPGSRS